MHTYFYEIQLDIYFGAGFHGTIPFSIIHGANRSHTVYEYRYYKKATCAQACWLKQHNIKEDVSNQKSMLGCKINLMFRDHTY